MIGHEQVRAHNNGDCWPDLCPCCDIEDAQDDAPKLPTCHNCGGDLGDSAWADDWTVITADAARIETRYTCDDCAPPQSVHYDITIPDETELPWTLPDGAA